LKIPLAKRKIYSSPNYQKADFPSPTPTHSLPSLTHPLPSPTEIIHPIHGFQHFHRVAAIRKNPFVKLVRKFRENPRFRALENMESFCELDHLGFLPKNTELPTRKLENCRKSASWKFTVFRQKTKVTEL
jgi:hypothetical protein